MQVRVIGGFSSWAKRAMIESWLSSVSNKRLGSKVTVLLNGEEDFITGIDLVDELDVQVELFAEGCFCCVLRDVLTETLIEQREGRKPDLILMSSSVIADLGQVEGLIRQVLGEGADLLTIFSLDLENATAIIDSFSQMVEANVGSADAVILLGDGVSANIEVGPIISKLKRMNAALADERTIDVHGKRGSFLGAPDIELFRQF
jgi:G3E family GTPase